MRKTLCLVSFIISSLSIFAQVNAPDTTIKFAFRCERTILCDFPLILLDDKEYKGDLKNLNVKIKYIEIFDGATGAALYGASGSNGVIVFGSRHNPPQYFYKLPPYSDFKGSLIYIIDGYLLEKNYVNQKDILKKDVISINKSNSIYGRKLDSIVIIITRRYAIKQYQSRLSALSKEYKSYLEVHQSDDSDVFYVLNGVPIETKRSDERTLALYNIPTDKIKTVNFMEQFYKGDLNNKKPVVLITTK